jgi:hypothetical protein
MIPRGNKCQAVGRCRQAYAWLNKDDDFMSYTSSLPEDN